MTARPAGAGRARISQTAENYLLSLAILEEDGVRPHISELAAHLRRIPEAENIGATLASVSGMVQRMAKDGLLKVTKEKRVELTADGLAGARDVVRRHRLAERLLVDILDIPLQRAESEAHRLEHGISPLLLQRIEEKLGYPESCPYGRPIYSANESGLRRSEPGTMPLSEAQVGASYAVVRIPDEDFPLLSYLVETEVLPGRRITVEDVAPYRGVVDFTCSDERVSLGFDVASRIRVRPEA